MSRRRHFGASRVKIAEMRGDGYGGLGFFFFYFFSFLLVWEHNLMADFNIVPADIMKKHGVHPVHSGR